MTRPSSLRAPWGPLLQSIRLLVSGDRDLSTDPGGGSEIIPNRQPPYPSSPRTTTLSTFHLPHLSTLGATLLALPFLASPSACGGKGGGKTKTGDLSIVATALASTSVAGVLYEVECEGQDPITEYVELEDEGLPPNLDPALGGQPFADLFLNLPVGDCTVTATAMSAPGDPAEDCEPVTQDVTVTAGETTEIIMVIPCEGEEHGGLDVVVVITDGISIIDVDYDDSKFILQCEEVQVTIGAEGGEGPLTYTFVVTSEPAGAVYTMSSSGPTLTFSAETPGTYQITVTVSDGATSTQLTFPIHVSDDPNIEHCDEECCQLADGHVFYGTSVACEEANGVTAPVDLCEAEICCKTSTGPAFVPAADCPQGAALPEDECHADAEICCKGPNGGLAVASVDQCESAGGTVVSMDICAEEVCCKLATPTIVPASDCPQQQVLPDDLCAEEELCCEVEGHHYLWTEELCEDKGGVIVSPELCEPTGCCKLPDGLQTLPVETCKELGGQVVSEELCKEICCEIEGAPSVITNPDECKVLGGLAVDVAECEGQQQHVWDAEYTLDPDEDCVTEPYVVVPSSGASQLAVYDTTTLEPLPTTPFDTCANPSRILMDGNTDCYASCRSDGRVNKHTRDGVLLWSTQLPGCNGSRGITMSGDGRLFAGCSDAGYSLVFELDPANGAVLGSVDTGWRVYGLAVDDEGVYVAHYFDGRVSKIYLGGANDMTMAWTVSQQAYGITVDQLDRVWVGGSQLVALSTVDGTVVDSQTIPITLPSGSASTAWTHGVMVGLDGNVYGATMQGVIYRYDPVTQTPTDWLLDTAATGNRGLTLDADGDIYSINLSSHTLSHTTPAGVSQGFGDDSGTVFLVNPYGYSGDMTGLAQTCMAGTTSAWFSTQIDSGDPATLWQTISWTATTPPGSNVSVYYSVDGGSTWTAATNGQTLNVTAQTFEVKVLLQSTIAGNEPTIHDVTITYQ